jgi:hypothetical protein
MIRKIKPLFVYFVMTAFMFVGFTQSARAAMISTEQVAAAHVAQQNRDKIAAALNRPEVIAELEKHGVSSDEAKARVAALSEDEAASLANKIDNLPAGGDSVVGALVLIFLVLLVTDLLGLTHVYPFVHHTK